MNRNFKELGELMAVMENTAKRIPNFQNTKLGYAWKRFCEKNIDPTLREINDQIVDERIECALVDPNTKEILYANPQQTAYKFDKDGLKKITAFVRKIQKEYETKDVEITPFICTDLPELTEEEKELLTGLVI